MRGDNRQTRSIGTRTVVGLLLGAAGLAASSSFADNRYWTGYQNDDAFMPNAASFHSDGNWYGLDTPDPGDRAVLGRGPGSPPPRQSNLTLGPHLIYFGNFYHWSFQAGTSYYFPAATATIANLDIRDDSWTFDFGRGNSGPGAAWPPPGDGALRVMSVPGQEGGTGFVNIGMGGVRPLWPTELRLMNGEMIVQNDVNVGQGHLAEGVLHLEGSTTQLTARNLRVGNGGGYGRLEIIDGARLVAGVGLGPFAGPNGAPNSMSVLVEGAGSSLVGFGGVDRGDASVRGGAHLSSFNPNNSLPGWAFVGPNGNASVLVRDHGSTWDGIDRLTVGGVYHTDTHGQGTLRILGGVVTAGWGTIANRTYVASPGVGPESLIEISGSGSIGNFAGMLTVGEQGRGRLEVQNSGVLNTGTAEVGADATARGTASVSSGADWNVSHALVIGRSGIGELTIDEASVRSENGEIGRNPGSTGNVILHSNFHEATWEIQNGLVVGRGGTGRLDVGANCLVSVGTEMLVGTNGIVSGTGTIRGAVRVAGGTISPGHSPGALTIEGNLRIESGTLVMEIAGASDFDRLVLPGAQTAQLGGNLEIRFINGFVPTRSTQFDLLAASPVSSVSGSFASVDVSGLPPTAVYRIAQDAGHTTIRLDLVRGTGCVADVDDGSGSGRSDGGVTIEDLLHFLAMYDAGDLQADLDDGSQTRTPDGGVGIDDLLFFLSHYDAGC
jgi:T5SS/PEP-CTERM-associated repeat protein